MKQQQPTNQNYHCGIGNETKVVNKLRRHGASASKNPGSRGAADIEAIFNNSSKKWSVQVKSTCVENGKPKQLTDAEKERLDAHAYENGTTPIIAEVTASGKITMWYLRSGRKIVI